MNDLRADNLIQKTAEKLNMPEKVVRSVVNSFFLDGFRYFVLRPTEAKGHIDLKPYFQIRISIPKLRYILSYKTYAKRAMVICGQLYKQLKNYGKRQTGFKAEHERLVESAWERTRIAIEEGRISGLEYSDRELSLRRLFPTEIDEIQRKYFQSKSEVPEPETEI